MDSVNCKASYVLIQSHVSDGPTNELLAEVVTFCNKQTSQNIGSTYNCLSTKHCLFPTKKRVQSSTTCDVRWSKRT